MGETAVRGCSVYSSNQQPGGGYTSGLRQPIYGQRPIFTGQIPGQQTPVYGGNYQQGSQPQTVFTYGGYGRGLPFDTASYSSECPDTGIRIQINGIPCEQAVDLHGTFLCYRHEYTSRECCQKCRPLKNPSRIGCEYGDHSGRCTDLRSYDCYDLRNRQSCCATCERLRQTGARAGCEYGDMTPNCDRVRQNPELCYIPENRYLCCDTCHSIRDLNDECPWGDQNSELCAPFDRLGNIRINCYSPPIRRLCCQSCPRIQEWLPGELQGCEYGDRPVTFSAGTHRSLNCTSFMRYFGAQQCVLNEAVATNCCYTCHRYSQA
ncbi:hypothetical protein C0Q70_05007 [Pomacea canaliculata]|uniref:Uncharacterized protein n=1 Tax=Pomacea canaliculata TaxID=400727 RepID=A0A2T7PK40_POMCA|nr:hypothetical protein C0Q70_05007 [Pomacea canaliculata]